MQETHFRYSIYIQRRKMTRIFVILLLLCSSFGYSQKKKKGIPHMLDHDSKPYYFGLSFSTNTTNYRLDKSEWFINEDSILLVDPVKRPGLGIGLLATLNLNKYFELRLIPTIVFSDRSIDFVENRYGAAPNVRDQFSAEAVLFHFPLSLKLKSDRINNFRFYAMGGVKFDWDMNSNARSKRLDEVIKVKSTDIGYELGGGLNFFFSNFVLSPEIKISRGLNNILVPDELSQISNSLEAVRTSMLMFTINLES